MQPCQKEKCKQAQNMLKKSLNLHAYSIPINRLYELRKVIQSNKLPIVEGDISIGEREGG